MVSYRDIANRAQVSEMTVSRVMHEDARVRPATRERVLTAAAELGYRRNPMVDALMKQVRSKRVLADVHHLAWIYPAPGVAGKTVYELYRAGAESRAEELGFKIDVFTLGDGEGLSPKRLREVLRARNVQGILLAPASAPSYDLEFDFEGFAVVTFGYTIRSPNLCRVSSHHSRNQLTILHQLREMGYRDVIYAAQFTTEERINFGWLSATMAFAKRYEKEMRVRSMFQDELHELLSTGKRADLPEVIIGDRVNPAELLTRFGLRVPEDLGFVTPTIETTAEYGIQMAGIDQNSREIGRRAVEYLAELLAMNRFGVPAHSSALLVEGDWTPGHSLPPRG